MFTQAGQHGLVQLLPDTSGIPVAQASPASHAAAIPKGLRKVFPWNACLQHEQDAVEGGFVADDELARTALGRGHKGWDQGVQLPPQFVAYGSSCHEGSEHNCFAGASVEVVLAALKVCSAATRIDLLETERLAQRIRLELSSDNSTRPPGTHLTISFGVTVITGRHQLAEALKEAHGLLYSAKNRGRDCVYLPDRMYPDTCFQNTIPQEPSAASCL